MSQQKNKRYQSVILPSIIATLSACTSPPDFDSVYTRLSSPSLEIGSAIPQPEEDIILTVSGDIGITNEGQDIVMDVPTIESIGIVEYTLVDPFEQQERTFTGVLMRDLLELWQVSPDATALEVTALNDFQIDVPINLVRDYPVIFAMTQDGEYMTPDYRGPAMFVLPYAHYRSIHGNDSYWVWQIETIHVK